MKGQFIVQVERDGYVDGYVVGFERYREDFLKFFYLMVGSWYLFFQVMYFCFLGFIVRYKWNRGKVNGSKLFLIQYECFFKMFFLGQVD